MWVPPSECEEAGDPADASAAVWQPHPATSHLYWVPERRLKYSGSSLLRSTCTATGAFLDWFEVIVQVILSSRKRPWAMKEGFFFPTAFPVMKVSESPFGSLGDGAQTSPQCASLNLCMLDAGIPHFSHHLEGNRILQPATTPSHSRPSLPLTDLSLRLSSFQAALYF